MKPIHLRLRGTPEHFSCGCGKDLFEKLPTAGYRCTACGAEYSAYTLQEAVPFAEETRQQTREFHDGHRFLSTVTDLLAHLGLFSTDNLNWALEQLERTHIFDEERHIQNLYRSIMTAMKQELTKRG